MLSYVYSDLWPQISFVLAKEIVEKKQHVSMLTPSEGEYFEQATKTLAQWVAFLALATDSPLTELDTSSFRVRALLYEQFIPHLFHANRPCCQHLQVDWRQLAAKAHALAPPDQADIDLAKHAFEQQRIEQLKKMQDHQDDDDANDQTPERHSTPMSATPMHHANGHTDDQDTPIDKNASQINTTDTDKIPLLDVYHSLESDQAVMIDEQKLKEYEAQAALNEEEEKEKTEDHSLSMFNTDGNFTLKYLLKGITANRDTSAISDKELQDLLSDFKPHRSKWANDDKQGQEELYDAMEKVLQDLKNYTQHSGPFLNKVSKREAPDYFDIIKRPMDLGTVSKKLKQLEYKSKNQFAEDLYLIYDNCLAYNTNPASEYRKHAAAMRRRTDKLLGRVPNIIIKDKNEPEPEDDGDDASDDDQEDKGRVSGKSSGKHKQPMKQLKKDESAPAESTDRASRERSLTRGSSAAPTDSIAGDTDRDMSPAVYDAHIKYGGKHPKGQVADRDDDDDEKDLELADLRDQVWREVTKKTRAELVRDWMDQSHEPFGEQVALVRSTIAMERFSMMEHVHDKTNVVRKLIRCPDKNLIQWTDRRRPADASLYDHDIDLDSSDDEILDAFFSRKIAKPKHADDDDATRQDLFLPEYQITAGVPEMPDHLNEEYKRDRHASQPQPRLLRKNSIDSAMDDLPPALDDKGYTDISVGVHPVAVFPNHGLNPLIDRNISCLLQIRRVYAKCKTIRNNASLATIAFDEDADTPEMTTLSPLPVDHKHLAITDSGLSPLPSSSATTLVDPLSSNSSSNSAIIEPPALILNDNTARDLFQLITTKLLAHAGFEGVQANALRVINDVAVDYISNMGKVLRAYMDDYSTKMSSEEILLHTLYENGVTQLTQLDTYIHDDVERYGYRLDDVHRRLQSSYQDLVNGSAEENTAVDEDAIFQEDDTFVTGLFGEDLGEDYFGFKDLGLDQELGLHSSSIPARLWFGRNKDNKSALTPSSKEPQYKYPPRPPFTPVTSSKQVIGLLQPYFEQKLADAEERLVEDEFNTNIRYRRPRYPPLQQSTSSSSRKKQKDYAASDKKAKRKRPTEEILAERAEKRRLKMEEKEKKLAEREQKRRLREEMKDKERQAKLEAKERKAQARKLSKQSQSAASPSVTDD
ncbi:hypothetical protein BC940DRAFT_257389 [Gongronella butleri]|nr:hypothetical protein BC940DRAFT_257389 [Gongronella butleri]